MVKVFTYVALVAITALISSATGFSPQQVLSIAVFVGFIAGTLLYWPFRLAFAFAGIAILLGAGLLDVTHLIEFASLDVILFLIGMMTVIGFLEERKFFEVLFNKMLPYVSNSGHRLMLVVMILSFVSAALVDEVTSILFMSAIVLRVARHYRLNPVPYIIMTVFATNIGSGATVVGNPIGVLIALRAGLTFPDFLRWATPIAIAAWVLTVILSFIYFKKPLHELNEQILRHRQSVGKEAEELSLREQLAKGTLPAGELGSESRLDGKQEGTETASHSQHAESKAAAQEADQTSSLVFPTLLFIGTIAGLILHKQIEHAFDLETNTMLVGVALAAAGLTLFVERKRARHLIETRVDWWTLAFFMLLFASVGTLQFVGVTDNIAQGVVSLTGGNLTTLFAVVTWSIGALTAFMDNVLAVATFIPIVGDLAKTGVATEPLWWGMLFGGTILGNLTLIGSTANIVALGLLERQEHRHVSFMEWFWPGLVTAVPSLLLAMILLLAQMPLLVKQ